MGVWSKKGRKENRDREAEWTLRKNRMPSTTNGNSLLELGNFHFHFHCKCILHGVAIYEGIWTVYQHIYVCVCVCACTYVWVIEWVQNTKRVRHNFISFMICIFAEISAAVKHGFYIEANWISCSFLIPMSRIYG